MTHIAKWALETPDKPAIIMAESGSVTTFKELDDRANQLARYLYERGLRHGDHVALLLPNTPGFMEAAWATMRSGLYLTAINRYLPADEVAYIVNDCGANALVTSRAMANVASSLVSAVPACAIRLMMDGPISGYEDYDEALFSQSTAKLDQEWMGSTMLYSSGTTGRPKGILRPLLRVTPEESLARPPTFNEYDIGPDTIYLTPAPLYHAAPLVYTQHTQGRGGAVVLMERFDAEAALAAIERYRVTHAQYVPTMFSRMLKLPADVRDRYDLSSQIMAMHGAAPCAVALKQAMIDWWGPILTEYYGGSEGSGATSIDSEAWLAHPGSVGRATLGTLHICDEAGDELASGEVGLIYFERDIQTFAYHNNPEATEAARHPVHPTWTTLGDVGYLDDEGYLYLTDRKAFMIISGGVNIYPQAIEDAFIVHPKVGDVAVFGVPDPDMGEAVKAVVEPATGVEPTAALAAELIDFARERLARFMVPRSIDFIAEMPRLPTGKLYKRLLKDRYWDLEKPSQS